MLEKIELTDEMTVTEQREAPIDLQNFLFGDDAPTKSDEGEEEKVKQMLEDLDEPEAEEEEAQEQEEEIEDNEPEELESSENDEPEGVENHESDNVPKKAMLAERKKFQKRLEDQAPYYKLGLALAEREGLTMDQVAEQIDEIIAKGYAEKNGMPLEDARREVAAESKERELKRREAIIDLKSEANGLRNSTVYTLLSDESVREEVVQFAATKGLSVKQAYRALYEDSYAAQSKRSQKPKKKVASTTPKPEGSKSGHGRELTPDEKAIAKMCGMTEDEWRKWS